MKKLETIKSKYWTTYRIWDTDELVVETENISDYIRLEKVPADGSSYIEIDLEEILSFAKYFVDEGYKELTDAD